VRQGEYSLPRLMPHKGDSVIEARRILARQSVFLNLQCAGDAVSLCESCWRTQRFDSRDDFHASAAIGLYEERPIKLTKIGPSFHSDLTGEQTYHNEASDVRGPLGRRFIGN
jgi:hypothetical protein